MSFFENYKSSILKEFKYYKALGDKSFAQLDVDDFYTSVNEHSNSIAIIMKHMQGNMLSRWTDFYTTDGEKEWRQRDAEFEEERLDKATLLANWEAAWNCLFVVLEPLEESDLQRIVTIRNEPHTVIQAINRQLAHYPYHIGQIVYLAKEIKGAAFPSLSIPKNASQAFNQKLMK